MSLKWRRSRQWDDEHFPAWAWPAKALLRAFSSIPLAVALLSLIVVYAILASVPIGLLALAPTYLFYGITLVLTVLAGAVLPVLAFVRATRGIGRRWWSGSGASFAVVLMLGLGLAVLGAMAWRSLLWPALQYDPLSGRGVRFLASFCDRYKAVTLRRLPGLEMSELEFYSWWPLRVILVAFVVNMIVATVRRIEFIFVNLGVLTVHTGIVVIALGSLYYKGLKLEGDTLLFAGEPGPDGVPTAGAPQRAFYDNTLVSLWVSQRNRGGADAARGGRARTGHEHGRRTAPVGLRGPAPGRGSGGGRAGRCRHLVPHRRLRDVRRARAGLDPQFARCLRLGRPGVAAQPALGVAR